MRNKTAAAVSVKENGNQQKEMHEVIRLKNNLLLRQEKRIQLLEDKVAELRKKYFQLKYSDVILHLKAAI
jgi:hypothetical protein